MREPNIRITNQQLVYCALIPSGSWRNVRSASRTAARRPLGLLTTSPDQSIDILDSTNDLEKHSLQIKMLAQKYGVGLVDSYEGFKQKVISGDSLTNYMSQVNHPNGKGNLLIANEIMKYFK